MSEETKRIGRPPGTGAAPEDKRNNRSIRLNEARWTKLKKLGAVWLENAIDEAHEVEPKGPSKSK